MRYTKRPELKLLVKADGGCFRGCSHSVKTGDEEEEVGKQASQFPQQNKCSFPLNNIQNTKRQMT
jgi:hypothetical protein